MNDNRLVNLGWEIPSEYYSDQPYVVKTDDDAWLCVMTTGSGLEGKSGQHIVSTRSLDQGRTWSALTDVEPADGPEASYAVVLKTPQGRIYCFYNHNTDDRRWVIAADPPYKDGKCFRVDSQGYFVFKYSGDNGKSWSAKRYTIPIREMAIDRENPYGGEVQYFWNVGKAFSHKGAAYVSVHKVGSLGNGFFTRSEGVLLKSDNLLTESDPEKITWETLPDGDAGLRAPAGGGAIAEEQSYSVLSDGTFYSIYRTIAGKPARAYSRDSGNTWSEPQFEHYASGRPIKHPRAANFAWRCENGHYLYWFHNHGGTWYEDRNPVWLCGGVEVDSPEGRVIQWSQPEIGLYDDDTYIRMSYPDLVEDKGNYYLLETQKDKARVHLLDENLLQGMWQQFGEEATVTKEGCVKELKQWQASVDVPSFPAFNKRSTDRADHGLEDLRAGFSLELWLQLDSLDPLQSLVDSRSENGQGLCLQTSDKGTLEIILNDGRTESRWDSDPDAVQAGKLHHVAVIVDGGPKLITFVVDGVICDGGDYRQFGWGRFHPQLRHVNSRAENRIISPGSETGEASSAPENRQNLRLAPEVKQLRVYHRYLRTSEVVGNYKAGM